MDHDAFFNQLYGQQPPQHLFDGIGDLPELDLVIQRHFGHIPPQHENREAQEMPVVRRSQGDVNPELSPEECEEAARDFFPDICPDYLRETARSRTWTVQGIIEHILDQAEQGNKYPKRSKSLKRKREDSQEDEEEELRRKIQAEPRHQDMGMEYFKQYKVAARELLVAEYPDIKVKHIDDELKRHYHSICQAYLAVDAEFAKESSEWRKKTTARPKTSIAEVIKKVSESSEAGQMGALEEFKTARGICQAKAAKARAKKAKEDEEAANYAQAEADGTILECGCCFGDFPQNRMVHCNADTIHFFCRECAKRMAETQVGLSKYQLDCMSMDGCQGSFNKSQKDLFLDEKLTLALDRIEQEAVLRIAGLEALETCPFCPYAAEYPPVEVDKEFKCISEDCGLVSCRLCRQETHLPKSCEEIARENGHSARREIEEAMSAAMIRNCNKCKTPFIKENGCNKMTCTRNGCGNMQCYVCSKSCDYAHFDDAARGGKRGNCPLFDSVEQRHAQEVLEAEEAARKKVAEANPDVDVSLLNIQFSDRVKEDESRRAAANPGPRRWHPPQIPEMGAPARAVGVHPPVAQAPGQIAIDADEMDRRRGRMQMLQQRNLEQAMEFQREARRNRERVMELAMQANGAAPMQAQAQIQQAQAQQAHAHAQNLQDQVAQAQQQFQAQLAQAQDQIRQAQAQALRAQDQARQAQAQAQWAQRQQAYAERMARVHLDEAQRAPQMKQPEAGLERNAVQRAPVDDAQRLRTMQQMQQLQQQRQQQQQPLMAAQLHRFPQGAPFPAVPRPIEPAQIPGGFFAPAGAAGGVFDARHIHRQGAHDPPAAIRNPQPVVAPVPNPFAPRPAQDANNKNDNDAAAGQGQRNLRVEANSAIDLTASPQERPRNNNPPTGQPYILPGW